MHKGKNFVHGTRVFNQSEFLISQLNEIGYALDSTGHVVFSFAVNSRRTSPMKKAAAVTHIDRLSDVHIPL
jgi:hypothetical protein